MANTFDFVCTLSLGKETDKFKPYEEKRFNSGWINRTLKFNAISGANRHMLEIKGGCWEDGHGSVMTFSKPPEGETRGGEKLEIPWGERNNKAQIDKVANFRKFVVDLEVPGRRYALKKIVDGEATDETYEVAGVGTVEDAEKALKASDEKRHEFIAEWDFATFVHKLVSSEKTKGVKFRVQGNINISEYEGKFYQHFEPTRIYRATDDAEPKVEASININYGKGAIDDGSVEEKGRYYINGYTFNYDSQRKKQIPCPVSLVLPVGKDEKSAAYVEVLKRNFTVNDIDGNICKELTVKVDCVNGAEILELTEDMLSDNEKDLLIIGAITMEDIARDRGQQVYGDRIREFVVTGFAKGWLSGSKPTAYTTDDFVLLPLETTSVDTVTNDIFSDDDDDIEI